MTGRDLSCSSWWLRIFTSWFALQMAALTADVYSAGSTSPSAEQTATHRRDNAGGRESLFNWRRKVWKRQR